MSDNKEVGLDNISIEVWGSLKDINIEWLTKQFKNITRTKQSLNEWRGITLILIYKNKQDIQNCANYRRVKHMSHTMRLWEMVIERRLIKDTWVIDNQFGFMSERSTKEVINSLCRVIKRHIRWIK